MRSSTLRGQPAQLAAQQLARPDVLRLVIDLAQRTLDVLLGDALTLQFHHQRTPTTAGELPPRPHPGVREGGVIDQLHLLHPIHHPVRNQLVDTVLAQTLHQLGPAAGTHGEQS